MSSIAQTTRKKGTCLMKKSGQVIRCGDFKVLQYAVKRTGIPGKWAKGENHYQFRAENGAVLKYWETTQRIYFEGPAIELAMLKAKVLRRAIVVD